MSAAVRYFTRSGNTRKLADMIAKTIGAESLDVSVPLKEKVDVLFLGCSYYAFDIDSAVKNFILNNKEKIGKIVCFGTSAMMKSMKKPVGKVADTVGIQIAEEEFHCRGEFMKMHKGRPNAEDLAACEAFAKKVSL